MERLAELLSKIRIVIPFFVYGRLFFISHLEQDGEIWVDIDPNDEMRMVRVRSDKELVDFFRSNVEQSLLFDEMIVDDVVNSVWRTLGYIFL